MIYFVIGLRPHHFPTKEEDLILFAYIRKKFPNRTIDELYLAFDLAINEKLDIDDWKVYDQFSIEYLVRIMNSYSRYVFSRMKEVKKPIAIEMNTKTISIDEKKNDVDEFLNVKEHNYEVIPLYLYDWMNELDMLEFTEQEKVNMYSKAIQKRRSILEKQLFQYPDDARTKNELDKLKKNIAENFKNASDIEIANIETMYKRIVLITKHQNHHK